MSTLPEADVDTADRTPAPTRRRRQSERRNLAERSLLDAARRLVARRGVDQTSVADIGVDAGYSRGLVNHRFGSKTALLQALARDSQQAVESIFQDTNEDKLESLIELMESYLSWIGNSTEDARAFLAMWGAALPEESVLQSVFVGFDDRFRHRIGGMVNAGQANGTITADVDPIGVAISYMAMLRGIGMQTMVAPPSVDLSTARLACEQFLRRTLAPADR